MSRKIPFPKSKAILAPASALVHHHGINHRMRPLHHPLSSDSFPNKDLIASPASCKIGIQYFAVLSPCDFRTFTSFSAVAFQSSSNNDVGGDTSTSGDGKDKTGKSPDKDKYDPKKDTFFTQDEAFGSPENKGIGDPNRPVFKPEEIKGSEGEEEELTSPTNCCMTGCPNCVWIDYVEKLSKKYTDPSMGRERILKELEEIDDENIKAYIMMELRIKKLI